jgi:hypothetical protein
MKVWIRYMSVAVLLAALVSCAGDKTGPITPEEAGGALYSGILEKPVRLQNGKYEGEPFVEGGASKDVVTLAGGFFTSGDLDGDGSGEAAVILALNSGGSGTFLHLAVLSRKDGSLKNMATVRLGDRIKPKALGISGGELTLAALKHGPDDPACCPTVEFSRMWKYENGILMEYVTVEDGQ